MAITWHYNLREGEVVYREGDCLSTDTKPITDETLKNGSKLMEMDTSIIYCFDKDNSRWLPWGGDSNAV